MKNFKLLILFPAFFPFITYLFPFIPNTIFGLQLVGFSWVFVFFMGLKILLDKGNQKSKFPIQYWTPWVLYLFFYLIVDFSIEGFQLTLQYIEFVLIGVIFSKFRYQNLEVLNMLKSSKFLLVYLCLTGVLVKLFIGGWTLYAANYVMILSVFSAIFLNIYFETKINKFILYFMILISLPIIENTRMATLVCLLIVPFTFSSITIFKRLFFVTLFFIGGITVFYSPSFQEKTFHSGRGEISDLLKNNNDNFNDSGRVLFKNLLKSGIDKNPVFGNGPRAEKKVIISAGTEITEAHNDYLSVLYNYGWTGLIFLLFGLIGMFVDILKQKKKIKFLIDKVLWSSSLVLILAMFLFMYSENILKYTVFFPNILFCLIGIFYSKINTNYVITPNYNSSQTKP